MIMLIDNIINYYTYYQCFVQWFNSYLNHNIFWDHYGWRIKSCAWLCILLQEHSGRVFRLQFDEFQIVSSSHDDTILIWDFLNVQVTENVTSMSSPCRTYTYVTKWSRLYIANLLILHSHYKAFPATGLWFKISFINY